MASTQKFLTVWGLDSSIFWVFCLFIVVLCIELQFRNKIFDIETINALRTNRGGLIKSKKLYFISHTNQLLFVIMLQVNIFIPGSFFGVEIPLASYTS